MPEVRFALPEAFDRPPFNRVPVEVLDQHMLAVAAILPGHPIDLAPGLYAARARLPDGRDLTTAFQLTQDKPTDPLRLVAAAFDATPSATPAARALLDATEVKAAASPALAGLAAADEEPLLRLRLLIGNALQDDLEKGPWQEKRAGERLRISGKARAQFIEIEESPMLIAVPVADGDVRDVEVAATADYGLFPHLHFDNPDLELALRYSGAGMDAQTQHLAGWNATLARRAFEDKELRPLASVVGAYALMRGGGSDGLEDWTAGLGEAYPWMADAWIVQGELLARLGRHEEALTAFARLESAGLPFFSPGLRYAVDRLRGYHLLSRAGEEARLFESPAAHMLLRTLFPRLLWISMRTDYSRPILTFAPPISPPHRRMMERLLQAGADAMSAVAWGAVRILQPLRTGKRTTARTDSNVLPG